MIKFDTWRQDDQHCPHCNALCTAATGMDGVRPKPGDVSVCIECQSVLAFEQDMSLRMATAEEVAEVSLDVSRIQNAMRKRKEL